MEQQLVLDLKDLSTLSIECPECHSELVVDVDSNLTTLPAVCPHPHCGAKWFPDEGKRDPLDDFIDDLAELRKTQRFKITFRLKATPWPAEVPKGQ
jgi:hypothetical protein